MRQLLRRKFQQGKAIIPRNNEASVAKRMLYTNAWELSRGWEWTDAHRAPKLNLPDDSIVSPMPKAAPYSKATANEFPTWDLHHIGIAKRIYTQNKHI